jgi:hypothetical protein
MKKSLFALLSAALVLSACDIPPGLTSRPGASAIETMVVETLQALTQSAPQGTQVSFENVSFVIPPGMGVGAASVVTDAIEYPPCANPSCVDPATVMPRHVVVTISGYPLAREARVVVFKASEFAGIRESFDLQISELLALKDRPESVQDVPGGSNFQVRSKYLVSGNGYGRGSLTQFNNGPVPINNADLFYYFQGLTDDGQHYVYTYLPVSAPFLVADSLPQTTLPPDAVPFGWANPADFDLQTYYQTLAQQIAAAAPETFKPDLNQIEALIQSLQVTSP